MIKKAIKWKENSEERTTEEKEQWRKKDCKKITIEEKKLK